MRSIDKACLIEATQVFLFTRQALISSVLSNEVFGRSLTDLIVIFNIIIISAMSIIKTQERSLSL